SPVSSVSVPVSICGQSAPQVTITTSQPSTTSEAFSASASDRDNDQQFCPSLFPQVTFTYAWRITEMPPLSSPQLGGAGTSWSWIDLANQPSGVYGVVVTVDASNGS